MENAFYNVFIHFIQKVGMESVYSDVSFIVSLAFIAVAFLLCFIGVKFFRTLGALMMYIMVAIFLIFVMQKANLGEIVIAFTLIGILAASITYKWYRLSAFIVAYYIGYSLAAPIFELAWINLIIGAVFGIGVLIFPVIGLMIVTSVWGGLYFIMEGISLLGFNMPAYVKLILCAVVIVSGVFVQYLISEELLALPLKERREKAIK